MDTRDGNHVHQGSENVELLADFSSSATSRDSSLPNPQHRLPLTTASLVPGDPPILLTSHTRTTSVHHLLTLACVPQYASGTISVCFWQVLRKGGNI